MTEYTPHPYNFESLDDAPLVIDAVYEGKHSGTGSKADEPLHRLLNVDNSGGFRYNGNRDNPSYVVLYTTERKPEWPDHLDIYSGVFTYYGDNKKPGRRLHETFKGGNQLLQKVFSLIDGAKKDREKIPPFFVFRKYHRGIGHDAQFIGLACPGKSFKDPDGDLIAIWKESNGIRFQNYKAYFTILDTKDELISRDWIKDLSENKENAQELAPKSWRTFIERGRDGIAPLKAQRILPTRKKEEQLPSTTQGKEILKSIYNYFETGYAFEEFGPKILKMLDERFINIQVTNRYRDGGFDGFGDYKIGSFQNELLVDFYIECKRYNIDNGCGVRETSRLISRIKQRQFGVIITTSYVADQAFKEIVEDKHPIIIVSGGDIVEILRKSGFVSKEQINAWLQANFSKT